jgi:hypothetical protein
MLEEVIDLTVGLGVALLPLLVLSVPAIVLFVVLPAILLLALAAPLALIGAVIAVPPYLVARRLRRRRRRTANPPAGHAARRGKRHNDGCAQAAERWAVPHVRGRSSSSLSIWP